MIANIKLIEKETIANGTMAFYFEKPLDFSYRAGQFANYTLIDPPETDDEGNMRSFSYVHAPFEDNIVIATRMRDTAFKRTLQKLAPGSELKMAGPFGDFTLHVNETTPAVFLIGGIGVTPVRSMIAQATHDHSRHKLTLLHANRTKADAPFTMDFEAFARENPNFKFIPVLSDEDNWQGESGHIDEAMIARHISDIQASIYYLSGPEGMVKAMRELLLTMKVNEDNIKTEEFAGY